VVNGMARVRPGMTVAPELETAELKPALTTVLR